MADLPNDIIRKIILESTREERSRKDALNYWTRNIYDHPRGHFARLRSLYDVHNQMKQVTRLERDACHRSALPLPGSPQADEGVGVMWRRVWWAKRANESVGAAAFFNVPWDEWDSFLQDRSPYLVEEAIAAIHYDPTGEFILAQHD
jgi:hypothetical protein